MSVAVRAQLKQATDAPHRRLHAHPWFRALMAGTLGLAGYRLWLARLYGFHAPLERALHAQLAGDDAAMIPGSAPLLRADLRALDGPAPALHALPQAAAPAYLTTPLSALGALYVVLGAHLGARLQAKASAPLFAAGATEGRCYLLGAADGANAKRFKALCARLEAHAADPLAVAVLSQAALATFAQFEAWFEPLSIVPRPDHDGQAHDEPA